MIKANELRIGNWIMVVDEDSLVMVTGIWDNIIKYKEDGDVAGRLKPIPLTPEILEKVGYKKGVGETYGWVWNDYKFNLTKDGFLYTDQWYKQNFAPVKYLHQLQNLYFALTGEELMIDDLNVERSVATKSNSSNSA